MIFLEQTTNIPEFNRSKISLANLTSYLSRDYALKPLQKSEKLSKDDFYFLYITLNLTHSEVANLFNKSTKWSINLAKHYQVKKDRYLVNKLNSMKNKKIWDKLTEEEVAKRTAKIRSTWHSYSTEKQSQKGIKLKKAWQNKSTDERLKISDNMKLIKQNRTEEQRLVTNKKIKNNWDLRTLEQRSIIKNKIKTTWNNKTLQEKQVIVSKIQAKESERISKIIASKRKNHTFNTSSNEEFIFKKLVTVFKNVERQYRTTLYPFNCDFYIPELDLYIEYNGFWTHGTRAFNPEDKLCCQQLKIWKTKAEENDFYKKAIFIWTNKDVAKRNTAKRNELNWVEFFNMKQFEDWFLAAKERTDDILRTDN